MLRIPYGISDYRKIREGNYYYVDKTKYLELLEEEGDILVNLRPSRFGKSLFTSMMYYYYDVNSKKLFANLFKDTYVFDKPTSKKNSYYVLRFDFSNISVSNKRVFDLEKEFLRKVIDGISKFNVDYGVDANICLENITPSGLLIEFLSYFRSLKLGHKLYIMIDEYDNFANTLLISDKDKFSDIVANEGMVSNFYSAIKEYCGIGIVDKVFITGTSPVVLEEIEMAFNTYVNISCDSKFSNMIELSNDEVLKLLDSVSDDSRDKMFKVMLDNYSGYRFTRDSNMRSFNTAMVMDFMREYNKVFRVPNVSLGHVLCNYNQLDVLLRLQNSKYYNEIVESLLKYGKIMGKFSNRINIKGEFTKNDVITLLYYFGYITIMEVSFGNSVLFGISNYAMKELYGSYFFKILRDNGVSLDNNSVNEIFKEIVLEGKIDKLSRYVETILKYIDNKLFLKIDESFIKLLYYVLLSGNPEFYVYSDYKCGNGYVDLVLFKNIELCKNDIMIEVRGLSSRDRINKRLIDRIRKDAEGELVVCQEDKNIDKAILRKYVVIFTGNSLVGIEELI